jgi:hypothetical protein
MITNDELKDIESLLKLMEYESDGWFGRAEEAIKLLLQEVKERPTREWEHSLQMTIRNQSEKIQELEKKLGTS